MNIQTKSVNTIRFLSMDAINKANSGHPGVVLGAAPMMYSLFANHLRATSKNKNWFNRDRFLLGVGHGSSMLYSMLHLTGYNVTIEDLKQFRQWGSKTPGHPEFGHTEGIDATSGPLGQGIAMATGMAVGESYLAARYNKDDLNVVDFYSYVLCGDGDLQEGVTQEAMSIAGHLGLGKLIVLYDSNDIQLDGPVSMTNSEDVKGKYEAMNWQYLKVEDGNDLEAINKAVAEAKLNTKQPTIIEVKTVIGFGSPLAGDSASHGAPIGVENTNKTRETLMHTEAEFTVADDVYAHMNEVITERGLKASNTWDETFKTYTSKYPELAKELTSLMNGEITVDFDAVLPKYEVGSNKATRESGGDVLSALSKACPFVIGGSADLTKSTKAKGLDGDFTAENRLGRNINYGVREHAMGAMLNGLALVGLKSFGGAFFVFSDYMKPAIRMSALMGLPTTFVFTHDSIAVGEDGPTHEPIEQLAGLRAIPNLDVLRPADGTEVAAAWRLALESKNRPSAIVLTRQGVVTSAGSSYEGVKKGGYVVSKESSKIDAILIAAGSEVSLAIEAQKMLLNEGVDVRVVSVPSFARFNEQSAEYKESVLPNASRKRLAIEMGASLGWYQYVGLDGDVLSIDRFGASAPAEVVMKEYGFSVENVVARTKELIKR